jgi:hypothetical protein
VTISREVSLGNVGRLYGGRYRIDRELWRAPHIQSLLVTDLRNGRPCVLRRLFLAAATPEDARRFDAQAAILARLDYPGLPRFVERFLEEGSRDPVLVTSYHPGENLERLMAKGRPLTESQAISVLRRIVPVLTYLHGFDQPLVHRAIKPTGIVIGPDGRPCLTDIDFLIPELATPSAEQAPPGPGEIALTAPEVSAGAAVPASDIYALGLAILCGMTKEDPAELLREGAKQRLREALQVSEPFASVLAQMLEPSLERRYADAQALEADLARLAGVKVVAAPPAAPAAPAAEEPQPRRRVRPWVLAGVLLALMGVAAVGVRLRREAPPQPGLLPPPAGERREQPVEPSPPVAAPPAVQTSAVTTPAGDQPAPASEAPQSSPPATAPQAVGEGAPSQDTSPAPAPAEPPAAPAAPARDTVVATGRLLLDGEPFRNTAAPAPVFWFRNEATKAIEKPQVDYADGSFRVRGLQPGRYGVSARIDLDSSNPNLYPGDLSAWSEATLEAGGSAVLELTLRKVLRLRQPVDNGVAIPGWELPCGTGSVIPQQAVFSWEPLDAAASYDVRIERLACGRGYAPAGTAFSRSTSETWVKVDLPPNKMGECYSLRLTANKGGKTIGILATHGKAGVGWDYRFSVAP